MIMFLSWVLLMSFSENIHGYPGSVGPPEVPFELRAGYGRIEGGVPGQTCSSKRHFFQSALATSPNIVPKMLIIECEGSPYEVRNCVSPQGTASHV